MHPPAHSDDVRVDVVAAVGAGDVFVGPAPLDELAAPQTDQPPGAVPMATFTAREWMIFRQGQRWGFEARQPEVNALQHAYQSAEYDADRYYRSTFDHDNHDCAIHANKGRYPGAKTRLLHWEYWGVPSEQDDAIEDPATQQFGV